MSKFDDPNLIILSDRIGKLNKKQGLLFLLALGFGYYVESQIRDIRKKHEDLILDVEELKRSQEE